MQRLGYTRLLEARGNEQHSADHLEATSRTSPARLFFLSPYVLFLNLACFHRPPSPPLRSRDAFYSTETLSVLHICDIASGLSNSLPTLVERERRTVRGTPLYV